MGEMEEDEEEVEEARQDKTPMKRRRGRPRLEKNAQKDNLKHWDEGICICWKSPIYACLF